MRLDKFICKSTDLSREEAQEVICQGEVSVNGETIVEPSVQVHENNHIELKGGTLLLRPSRYIMLHKPMNTLSSHIDGDYPSVMACLGFERVDDLHIAGRLDADTTGLLLITDDGRWSFNIFNPKYHCEKTYRVILRDAISCDAITQLEQGVLLQNEPKPTLPAKVEVLDSKLVLLTITEGRYHQVKRMFAAVGNRVNGLHRQKVGNLELDIPVGDWRYLTTQEAADFGVRTLSS